MLKLTDLTKYRVQESPNNFVRVGRATLYCGDSTDILPHLSDIHACVTDPPYGLALMGKNWDYDVPQAALWSLVRDTLLPGAHLLAFGGSRTYHRLAVQVEDADFEIRDQLMWLYASGFPKNHDLGKAIEAKLTTGGAGPINQRRAAMGDNYEPTPLAGTPGYAQAGNMFRGTTGDRHEREQHYLELTTSEAQQSAGWGTALKPSHEPIVMARKSFRGSCTANVMKHGVGGLNIEASRTAEGRWPANTIHDGLDEPWANYFYCAKPSNRERDEGLGHLAKRDSVFLQTGGGMSGKPTKGRAMNAPRANVHPTVKPVALMAYLCRLVTPQGGVVLDPFMGSGSTGIAALQEGFDFVGIERDPEYFKIACARIAHAQGLMLDIAA
ncbi:MULTISPECIES: DNA-methyltransferase [Sphingomonas]|uniref:DNA-methyltransferase n=1 Tax=Sphingomonas TaxID=13687 RepID=UPI000DEF4071|nr:MULTISPECIES: site-specific DNA-methyltransferase [Sphingomonas]